MNERFEAVKNLIQEGHTQEAIQQLNSLISLHPDTAAEAFYLLGNAYRKEGNWQYALNNYQEAIDLNPESPAQEAYQMVMDILNFYNKDMFNQ
ncbi:tetratricopeptide repeat protein [uncultured Phocaeicola sp.]|jgi:tetratricopeptide (TPR) repeat protein|uniref:tetratricopeptide repeat protein n=1 Tax=uncultured Phocaeicola sp. TaxID=990718 RepID=UPI0015B14812|nr:tetratricopeptide repeat protein [uncultured Phocaeicola sp.]